MNQDIFFHVIWLKYTLNIYNFLLCCCVVCHKAMLYEHSWETFLHFGMISFFVIFGWFWWITPIYRLMQCKGPETLLTGQFSQWNQEDFSILILNLLRRFKIFKHNIHRYTSQSSFLVLKIGTLVVWPAVTLSAKRHALLINTTPNTTCTRPVYRRYFD